MSENDEQTKISLGGQLTSLPLLRSQTKGKGHASLEDIGKLRYVDGKEGSYPIH